MNFLKQSTCSTEPCSRAGLQIPHGLRELAVPVKELWAAAPHLAMAIVIAYDVLKDILSWLTCRTRDATKSPPRL
jgi:hypothetical protein